MTQPPATPTLPRLPRDVVPADNRDDPEIILNTTTRTRQSRETNLESQGPESPGFQTDPGFPSLCPQYYYSVRVFAGQEPSCVWVGWVTPDYHQHDMSFDLSKVRAVTVTMGDEQGNVHSRCQDCGEDPPPPPPPSPPRTSS
ncbi:Ryanodine receptor 1 [Saguinus oedipus]|uniref:Ryanodine receptor 1 n=1 Tax=Saguinus oedipus TaxID=9490 RepID=A0ABQ9TW27_SAGOE|nr:Ryanodine receptor 1 [Saguinus oedipus]